MTFAIITYTKNFLKCPSWLSEERNTCKTDRRLQLIAKMNCQGSGHRAERSLET